MNWKPFAFVFVLIALIGFASFFSGCSLRTPETGWHRGVITDVSSAGLFCETYEGQVMTGTGNSAIHYNFTVTNKAAFDALKEAQASGIPVNLRYTVPFIRTLCSSLNGHFVDRVEPWSLTAPGGS